MGEVYQETHKAPFLHPAVLVFPLQLILKSGWIYRGLSYSDSGIGQRGSSLWITGTRTMSSLSLLLPLLGSAGA